MTFETIKSFMQRQDPNGTWYEAEETRDELMYIHNTILEWSKDGLDITPLIDSMLLWIEEKFAMNDWDIRVLG